jgi:hypothetical protein
LSLSTVSIVGAPAFENRFAIVVHEHDYDESFSNTPTLPVVDLAGPCAAPLQGKVLRIRGFRKAKVIARQRAAGRRYSLAR